MKRFISAWLDRGKAAARGDAGGSGDASAIGVASGSGDAAAIGAAAVPGSPAATDAGPLCALPERLSLSQAGRVLVFAPHPDDETIGCGGALALLAQAGVPVRVVLVSDGAGAGGLPEGAAAVRQQEFAAALRQLGVADHAMLGFPDGGLSLQAPLLQAIQDQVDAYAPSWIFAPARADLHRDHRVVAQAVRVAALANLGVQRLCEYETWGPLPVTHVLDIGAVLATKMGALAQHRTALACGDYLEAATGLARYRGLLLGTAAAAYAEGFVCSDRASRFAWRRAWGEAL